MNYEELASRHEERTQRAEAMGGEKKLAQRAEAGKLNARQRVAHLFDDESFIETGKFATSAVPKDFDTTPGDGKVTGTGAVDGRTAAVIAYDFTVKGASSSAISNKKMQHMKDLSRDAGIPLIYLNESTGVRMPDIMGGMGMGNGNDRTRFLRKRESPWVAATFDYSFGSATWHAVSSDFTVMRKGTVMAVSSPGLVSRATGQQVDAEVLGGWRTHAQITGFADAVASSDEEAIEIIKTFLSYLPSNNTEAPPVYPVTPGSGDNVQSLRDLVPESPAQVYDMRKVIRAIADEGSFFEIKAQFGKSLVTGLSRFDGKSVGIIANNPLSKGGAIDVAACEKATSFLVLCDSYNIPVLFLVDQPGFLIGVEAEHEGVAGKIVNWMNALALTTVPKTTVMLRKNYGQAYANMGGSHTAEAMAAWWSAEISFMDPRSAVGVVYGINAEEHPEEFHERYQEMARETTAYDVARVYGVHDVIDPVRTRDYVIHAFEVNALRRTGGVGQHLLSTWPTSY